jgi:hypothetical protein
MPALQFATATANLASQNALLFLATHGPFSSPHPPLIDSLLKTLIDSWLWKMAHFKLSCELAGHDQDVMPSVMRRSSRCKRASHTAVAKCHTGERGRLQRTGRDPEFVSRLHR